MATIRSVIRGIGSYLPEKRVTNDDLSKLVDTSDEWIVQRTGIRARHQAAEGEFTSDLATKAAERALADAGLKGSDIDLIVLATSTPDNTFPATATTVQANIGMTGGAAFDVQAVCTGFVYGLSIADNFLRSGSAKHALVIGAETYSRILDWSDRTTCVLFGDGAGAVVVEATMNDGSIHDQGVLATKLRSDGRHKSKLYVDGGASTTGTVGKLRMDGKEVFKLAVGMVPQIIIDTMDDLGLPYDAVDWFVPHQANARIIHATAEKLGLPPEKVVLTVSEHANTSSASIPLALDTAVKDGRIKRGDLVLLEAMGGGFTWGASLIRW
ncbi:ketoacyl-ACP synthase III [Labrys sp. LIt4]|uniref:Beta-ketoacyl-[acyl-carrier-protein] synthase III n=1 Tax=Labrys okinawensis TaxID=346911 RepID=A0A2S9QCJ0_9HYPH|nr:MULTISPECIES: beta-ketoacyl-ACP synthase III [Labrys]MBP0579183.1 ketoacyl-ACP synthase III [Labrys sp. LIt4]PRH87062.1 3-oxoacyl-ACP synthase [Labrys okinawensis]